MIIRQGSIDKTNRVVQARKKLKVKCTTQVNNNKANRRTQWLGSSSHRELNCYFAKSLWHWEMVSYVGAPWGVEQARQDA